MDDCNYIAAIGVVVCNILDRSDGLGDCVPLLPADGAVFAGVVETVLASWCTMEVDHHFESSTTCPPNCIVEDWNLPLYVRVAIKGRNSPVSDRYTDVIEARSCNSIKVILGDPGIPMISQTG